MPGDHAEETAIRQDAEHDANTVLIRELAERVAENVRLSAAYTAVVAALAEANRERDRNAAWHANALRREKEAVRVSREWFAEWERMSAWFSLLAFDVRAGNIEAARARAATAFPQGPGTTAAPTANAFAEALSFVRQRALADAAAIADKVAERGDEIGSTEQTLAASEIASAIRGLGGAPTAPTPAEK